MTISSKAWCLAKLLVRKPCRRRKLWRVSRRSDIPPNVCVRTLLSFVLGVFGKESKLRLPNVCGCLLHFSTKAQEVEAVLIGELSFRQRRLGAMALVFSCCLIGQSAYSADPACAKWFDLNVKKIQSNCELDCATFGTDMGTFHCLNT